MIDDFKAPKVIKPSTKLDRTILPTKPIISNEESKFKTPEEVAAEETVMAQPLGLPVTAVKPTPQQRGRLRNFFSWPPSRREYLFLAIIVILIAGSVSALVLLQPKSKPIAAHLPVKIIKKVVPPAPTTVASTLSGLPVSPSVNLLPVTGVMIENSMEARPQSGLAQASVIFEAIAEGGITRFLALYQDTQPSNVGPIRSARPYYVQWNLGFDAGYAHVGGSPEALADITAWGVRDLNQFYNGDSYHRIASRAAPHNVYTSIALLNQLEASKGYTSSNFTGFLRKPDAKLAKPTTTSIDLAISWSDYNVHYDYNPATNSYNRSEGGAAHIDAETSAQLSPKVVIAMVVPYNLEADGYHSAYAVIGSGTAYIFQDGGVISATWNKPDSKTQISFTDSTGKSIALNAGQTWITALSDSSKVNYQ